MPCVITMLDEVNFLLLFKWVVLYDGSLHSYIGTQVLGTQVLGTQVLPYRYPRTGTRY